MDMNMQNNMYPLDRQIEIKMIIHNFAYVPVSDNKKHFFLVHVAIFVTFSNELTVTYLRDINFSFY